MFQVLLFGKELGVSVGSEGHAIAALSQMISVQSRSWVFSSPDVVIRDN